MMAVPEGGISASPAGPSSPSRTWKVDTYCRVKPRLPGDTATHIRYEFKGGSSDSGKGGPAVLRISLPDGSAPYIWNNRKNDMDFQFTEVFRPDVQQEYVYDRVARDVVYSSLSGYNGTIFAYGQTGSGKTYTMTGGESFSERGLIPRAIHDVYKEIKRRPGKRYRVLVSYMEVYKESVYDLLDTNSRNKPLEEWTKIQMLDDEDGEMHLRHLKLYEAASEEDALNLLFLGNWNRITSAMPMNEASSRSHCIFTLRIQGEGTSGGGRTTVSTSGKLHLVDLAGSERMYKTDAETMLKTRIEGRYINLSLHYLEQVIVTLQRRQQQQAAAGGRGRAVGSFHVPYRNSVMTSILRDSLGGNCRTVFVVTLNTEVDHLEEAISTCRFALRCAQLSMDVLANEEVNAEELAASLKLEVGALRSRLQVTEKKLQEVLLQLQDLHQRHGARPLSQEERQRCMQLVTAFTQGEDSSWVFDTDRPLLEHCLRLMRRQQQAMQPQNPPSSSSSRHVHAPAAHHYHERAHGGDREGRLDAASPFTYPRSFPPPPPPPPPLPPSSSSSLLPRPLSPVACRASPSASSSCFTPDTMQPSSSLLLLDLHSPVVMAKQRRMTRRTTGGQDGGEQQQPQQQYEEQPGGSSTMMMVTAEQQQLDEEEGEGLMCTAQGSMLMADEEEEDGEVAEGGMAAYLERLLTAGGPFLKEGRQGRWHARFVLVSPDLTRLMWRKEGDEGVRGWVPLHAFTHVAEGPGQAALTLCGHERHVTLELMQQEGQGGGREVSELRDEWAQAFRHAIARCKAAAANHHTTSSSSHHLSLSRQAPPYS